MNTNKITRRAKYNNVKQVVDGITFDSKKEATRYFELKLLQRAGQISDLKTQVAFDIAPDCYIHGKLSRARQYIADFTYSVIKTGEHVVEDVKGKLTDVYILKRHLMKVVHNIEIKEV